MLAELAQDIKVGWRALWKTPGFAVTALLSIGIGIGANAAIFSYVDGALLRPLPYANGSRIVRLIEVDPQHRPQRVSPGAYHDWVGQADDFEAITAQQWNTAPFDGGDAVFELPNERVSVHFFDVFRLRPQLGRVFIEGEDRPGREHVAVLSHVFWMTQFGGDPSILGRRFKLENELYTVVGVMPAGAFDRTSTKLWRPLVLTSASTNRSNRSINCWASLKPGISISAAQVEMQTIAAREAREFPATNKNWSIQVDSIGSILVGPEVRRSLFTLMGAVLLVLIIACANLANLTLARATSRSREVAIRAALGAGRGRLVRQFLTESVMLAGLGGLFGLGIAYVGMDGLRQVVPGKYLPANVYVSLDGRVLLFIVGLAVVSGIAFGLYPALQASKANLTASIQQAGRGTSAGRSSRIFRATLVVIEVALAFILLNGAGLLIRSFFNLQHVDRGFDAVDMLTARLPIDFGRVSNGASLSAYVRRIVDRAAAVPGVTAAAVSAAIPLSDGGGYGMTFRLPGRDGGNPEQPPECYFQIVTPSYFRTLGLPLRLGRLLNGHDIAGSAPAALINQTLAARYFPNRNPIGQSISIPPLSFGAHRPAGSPAWEIVGVVADEKLSASGEKKPGVYVTVDQCPQPYQSLLVRTSGDANRVARALEAAVQEVEPTQRLLYPQTLAEIEARTSGDGRLHSLLLSIFAGIAVCLSVTGLYGVISYSVGQRTREFGIRAALGATRADVVWMVLRGGLTLTGVGLLVGGVGAMGFAQILSSLLFRIGKYDPVTLLGVAALVGTMMLIATLLPARRALRINPLEALRQD